MQPPLQIVAPELTVVLDELLYSLSLSLLFPFLCNGANNSFGGCRDFLIMDRKMLARPLGHSRVVLLTWLKVIKFSSEHLSQPLTPSHTPAIASWVLESSLACQDVIPVARALSVARVGGEWGLGQQ